MFLQQLPERMNELLLLCHATLMFWVKHSQSASRIAHFKYGFHPRLFIIFHVNVSLFHAVPVRRLAIGNPVMTFTLSLRGRAIMAGEPRISLNPPSCSLPPDITEPALVQPAPGHH